MKLHHAALSTKVAPMAAKLLPPRFLMWLLSFAALCSNCLAHLPALADTAHAAHYDRSLSVTLHDSSSIAAHGQPQLGALQPGNEAHEDEAQPRTIVPVLKRFSKQFQHPLGALQAAREAHAHEDAPWDVVPVLKQPEAEAVRPASLWHLRHAACVCLRSAKSKLGSQHACIGCL